MSAIIQLLSELRKVPKMAAGRLGALGSARMALGLEFGRPGESSSIF